MNLPTVVIDAKKQTYARYLNRCFHVKVKAETALTREEVEGFRVKPTLWVEGVLPPEPKRA